MNTTMGMAIDDCNASLGTPQLTSGQLLADVTVIAQAILLQPAFVRNQDNILCVR